MNSPRALLAVSVLFGSLTALPAQTTPAPAAPAALAAPAKPADKTAKKDAKKAEEKEGKIVGQALNRANGTFLGLTLEEGKFKLTFYDKKKKPMAVDVTRAIARWPNVHGPGDNRTVLNPAGPNALLGAQFVRGPYSFKLFITLLKGEGDAAQAVETFTVDFRG